MKKLLVLLCATVVVISACSSEQAPIAQDNSNTAPVHTSTTKVLTATNNIFV